MFPGVDGFRWDAGHLVFLGAFFSVLLVVATTLAISTWRAIRDFRGRKAEAIRWHLDFDDLTADDRRCRHELTREVKQRSCDHGFDCPQCTRHPSFLSLHDPGVPAAVVEKVAGLDVPLNRYYHRGHTWVQANDDGTVTIGLDPLAQRLIGRPDIVELPPPGEDEYFVGLRLSA